MSIKEINHEYSLESSEHLACNYDRNIYIYLSKIVDRKNMSIIRLSKMINYLFLMEYLCILNEDMGNFDFNICDNCPIDKILFEMNVLV